MTNHEIDLRALWRQTRDRLLERNLLEGPEANLSLREPAGQTMWFGMAGAEPVAMSWRDSASLPTPTARLHAQVYGVRGDAGGVMVGGGVFGRRLSDFGGALPGVFDEQVRHVGRMGPAATAPGDLAQALAAGGNALIMRGEPLCIGTTAARLAMNAELFEKCAKAFVLATATGGRVKPLPWVVRHVANRRLMKDERRAAERFACGLLPEETKGY
jgi:hypothetical protein